MTGAAVLTRHLLGSRALRAQAQAPRPDTLSVWRRVAIAPGIHRLVLGHRTDAEGDGVGGIRIHHSADADPARE